MDQGYLPPIKRSSRLNPVSHALGGLVLSVSLALLLFVFFLLSMSSSAFGPATHKETKRNITT